MPPRHRFRPHARVFGNVVRKILPAAMTSTFLENVVAVMRHVRLLRGAERLEKMHRHIDAKRRTRGGGEREGNHDRAVVGKGNETLIEELVEVRNERQLIARIFNLMSKWI